MAAVSPEKSWLKAITGWGSPTFDRRIVRNYGVVSLPADFRIFVERSRRGDDSVFLRLGEHALSEKPFRLETTFDELFPRVVGQARYQRSLVLPTYWEVVSVTLDVTAQPPGHPEDSLVTTVLLVSTTLALSTVNSGRLQDYRIADDVQMDGYRGALRDSLGRELESACRSKLLGNRLVCNRAKD